MKRVLIVFVLCLLCFGCRKNEKNITINIYDNRGNKSDVIEKSLNTEKDSITNKESNNSETYQLNDKDIKNNKNSTLNNIKDKASSTYNSTKTWYNNNKGEIKFSM